jgi:hypothetical protein
MCGRYVLKEPLDLLQRMFRYSSSEIRQLCQSGSADEAAKSRGNSVGAKQRSIYAGLVPYRNALTGPRDLPADELRLEGD